MAASTITFTVTKTAGVAGTSPDLYNIVTTTNALAGSQEWRIRVNPNAEGPVEAVKEAVWNEFARQAALAT